MTNYKYGGKRIPYSNAGSAIASGGVVVLNAGGAANHLNVGIAVDAIAATTGTGILQTGGVFALPKTAGEAYVTGQDLYWTGTAVTAASTGNTWIGQAAEPAASGDATVNTMVNGRIYPE